ncbi:MAG: hypothetical protein HY329_11405 [Chloroflexi bacterium]|nr:hypothetical protein [Chloroflexota bacterium]
MSTTTSNSAWCHQVAAAGFGAGLMYLVDPKSGRRRRALIRDQVGHFDHALRRLAGSAIHDTRNHLRGLSATVVSRLGERDVGDDILVDRVRSKLGRVVRHPRSISVNVIAGQVTLAGPVLADEVDALVAGVAGVRGVKGVETRFEVYVEPGNVPELQGTARPPSGLTHPRPLSVRCAGRWLIVAFGLGIVAQRIYRRGRVPKAAVLLALALLGVRLGGEARTGIGERASGAVVTVATASEDRRSWPKDRTPGSSSESAPEILVGSLG